MEQNAEISPEKLSKINAAGLINLTLKDLWESYYKYIRTRQYTDANSVLDCLWVEFGGDVKEGSDDEKEYNKIDIEVAENFSSVPHPVGFKKLQPSELQILSKQYKLLVKKALFLKRLQNQQGKGTAYYDESDAFMD